MLYVKQVPSISGLWNLGLGLICVQMNRKTVPISEERIPIKSLALLNKIGFQQKLGKGQIFPGGDLDIEKASPDGMDREPGMFHD